MFFASFVIAGVSKTALGCSTMPTEGGKSESSAATTRITKPITRQALHPPRDAYFRFATTIVFDVLALAITTRITERGARWKSIPGVTTLAVDSVGDTAILPLAAAAAAAETLQIRGLNVSRNAAESLERERSVFYLSNSGGSRLTVVQPSSRKTTFPGVPRRWTATVTTFRAIGVTANAPAHVVILTVRSEETMRTIIIAARAWLYLEIRMIPITYPNFAIVNAPRFLRILSL